MFKTAREYRVNKAHQRGIDSVAIQVASGVALHVRHKHWIPWHVDNISVLQADGRKIVDAHNHLSLPFSYGRPIDLAIRPIFCRRGFYSARSKAST